LKTKMETSFAAVAFAERNQASEAVLLLKGVETEPAEAKRAPRPAQPARKPRPTLRAE
jgi:hypothetical protein